MVDQIDLRQDMPKAQPGFLGSSKAVGWSILYSKPSWAFFPIFLVLEEWKTANKGRLTMLDLKDALYITQLHGLNEQISKRKYLLRLHVTLGYPAWGQQR